MQSNSTINIKSNNVFYNNEKIDSTEENNRALLKDLKNTIDELEKKKLETEERIKELKERIIDINIIENIEAFKSLEKERDSMKQKASNSLALCTQMAEDLIVLRDKLDKFNHINQK